MSHVLNTYEHNVLFNKPWIDKQMLLPEISDDNKLERIYYKCFGCSDIFIIDFESYLLIAGAMSIHKRKCPKSPVWRIEERELLNEARMKFFFMLKKLNKLDIKHNYVMDTKEKTYYESMKEQSRLLELPWDIKDSVKVWE
jgi:hypothetical protein